MKCFIFSILFSLSVLSQAGDDAWHGEKVSMLYPLANGDFVISFANFPTDCTNSSKYMYVKVGARGMTLEGANKLYSLAMMAFASGKALSVNYLKTSPTCDINRMYVSG